MLVWKLPLFSVEPDPIRQLCQSLSWKYRPELWSMEQCRSVPLFRDWTNGDPKKRQRRHRDSILFGSDIYLDVGQQFDLELDVSLGLAQRLQLCFSISDFLVILRLELCISVYLNQFRLLCGLQLRFASVDDLVVRFSRQLFGLFPSLVSIFFRLCGFLVCSCTGPAFLYIGCQDSGQRQLFQQLYDSRHLPLLVSSQRLCLCWSICQ